MHYIKFSELNELDEMHIVNHFPGTHYIIMYTILLYYIILYYIISILCHVMLYCVLVRCVVPHCAASCASHILDPRACSNTPRAR